MTDAPTWGRGLDDPESSDAAPDERAEARALLARAGGVRRRAWLGGWKRRSVAAAIIAAAIGYLVYQGLTQASQYFLTTKQAVAQRQSLGGRTFRIEGTVENDVTYAGQDLDFDIYANGVAVRIVSTGSPSQLFKPGIPVVLVGHWQGVYYASDQIMVKHGASYAAAHPDRLKSQLPKGGS